MSRRAKKSSPNLKKKMAEQNPDKSYGWYTAQHFSDYIERVVGEFNIIKFISTIVTIIPTLLR